MRPVAITGVGVICAGGNSAAEFLETLKRGETKIAPVSHADLQDFSNRSAGLVSLADADLASDLPEGSVSTDRYILLARRAAHEALVSAGLGPADCAEAALLVGTCSGPMLSIEKYYAELLVHDETTASKAYPSSDRSYNSVTVHLASELGIGGPLRTVTTACSSSAAAIGLAAELIALGVVDVALAGGSDSFAPSTFVGFTGLKAIAEGPCAPFSKPYGMNLGEGAAFLLLESAAHAEARKALVLGTVLGFGSSNDAHHPTAPDASGRTQALALERALQASGTVKDEIVYINAHGTGTAANDRAETKAVLRVLANHENTLRMSSTKSITGHCLGAAGAVEIAAALLCIHEGIYPNTANYSEPREGCSIDAVPDAGRPWDGGGVFLSNNFAFAGNNVCLALGVGPVGIDHVLPDGKLHPEIVITGIGAVSPAGIGSEVLAAAFEAALPAVPLCNRVPDFDPRSVSRRLDLRDVDRAGTFAAVAAKLAIAAAGISERPDSLSQLGLFIGLDTGSTAAEAAHVLPLVREGMQVRGVQAFPYIVPNAVGGNVCRVLSLSGHNTVFADGQGSGLAALVSASLAIRAGKAAAILAGSAEEIPSAAGIPDASSSAEGAILFCLEAAASAEKRGARVLGTLVGTACAFYPDDADGSAAVHWLSAFLQKSDLDVSKIGYICLDRSSAAFSVRLASLIPCAELRIAEEYLGNMPAGGTLAAISAILAGNLSKSGEINYILGLSISTAGYCTAVAIKTAG